ncbi:DUF6270 domain-containing protein [Massilia sp.]|uniref:DUF6270 domain-containing protein n=1 Tax=Massilia sp. TaxID=1882437 RepID=UPI0028AC04AB|nr:DUF6270 domain-containing protein [Massilia sp.]
MHKSLTPPRLLVVGSCVSRDILNFLKKDQFTLADYYARSSLAALTTLPAELAASQLERIASPFQRKTVERETTKDLYRNSIGRIEADAVLIDLIDERFDTYEAAPGALITASVELHESGFFTDKDRDGDQWVRSGSQRHRELWQRGVERLFAKLKAYGLDQRVIVNKVFWADQFEDGTPLPNDNVKKRRLANEHLAWMYSELERYVPAKRWLVADAQNLRASSQHRWGVAPFHYGDAYYQQMTRQLVPMLEDIRQDGALSVFQENAVLKIRIATPPSSRFLFAFGVSKNGRVLHTQPYSARPWAHFDAAEAVAGATIWVHILDLGCRLGVDGEPVRTTRVLTCTIDDN